MSIAITIFVMVFAGTKLVRLGNKESPDTSVTESFINLQAEFNTYNLKTLSYQIMPMVKSPWGLPPSFGRIRVKNYDPVEDKDKFLPINQMTEEKAKHFIKDKKDFEIY